MDEAREAFNTAFATVPNCSTESECRNLKNATENLHCPIDLSAINTTVTKNFTTQLEHTVAELEQRLANVTNAIKDINSSTGQMVDSVEKNLDLKTVLDSINKFWNDTSAQ
uniref:t-SNARE coiled-coil homology domain-containing protein n=3 Tax=Mesocestoides corti TaxID=53468 RepID=A0A5K3FX58_MESCO